MNITCIIPARYASTRLPEKPLADIAGKPMIQRVYEQVKQAKYIDEVLVATDDERIFHCVQSFGGKVILTSPSHPTGTDRLAEVVKKRPEIDVIINVQGDEPLIEPSVIELLAQTMHQEDDIPMATISSPLLEEEYDDPNAVKVVTNLKGNALYFSRSLLPYPRNHTSDGMSRKHVGIYAYTREFLLNFAAMQPTPLERVESLEQLRALENGYNIRVIPVDQRFVGVDTVEDLRRVNEIFRKREKCI